MLKLREIAMDILRGKLPAAAADDLAKTRINICEECPEFTKISRQCKQCGCFMDIKVKLLKATCPIDKF